MFQQRIASLSGYAALTRPTLTTKILDSRLQTSGMTEQKKQIPREVLRVAQESFIACTPRDEKKETLDSRVRENDR